MKSFPPGKTKDILYKIRLDACPPIFPGRLGIYFLKDQNAFLRKAIEAPLKQKFLVGIGKHVQDIIQNQAGHITQIQCSKNVSRFKPDAMIMIKSPRKTNLFLIDVKPQKGRFRRQKGRQTVQHQPVTASQVANDPLPGYVGFDQLKRAGKPPHKKMRQYFGRIPAGNRPHAGTKWKKTEFFTDSG